MYCNNAAAHVLGPAGKTLHFFNINTITPLTHNPDLSPVEQGEGEGDIIIFYS
jgi:hypothetical protein